jgi:type IV secretion system protein VirD4
VEYYWSRFLRAALALGWLCVGLVTAWQAGPSWWSFAAVLVVWLGVGALLALVIALLVGLGMTVFVTPLRWLLQRRSSGIHGTARWQTGREIKSGNLTRGGQIYLGAWRDYEGKRHTLTTNGGEHVLVVGSSRSGKGTSNILPTLLDWRNSAIVYDEKRELSTLTAGWREVEAGNRVLRFEPASPLAGDRYNFLDAVRLSTEHETGDISNIVEVLADDAGPLAGDAVHWMQTAKELVSAVALYVLYREDAAGRRAGLADVSHALADPALPIASLLTMMKQHSNRFVASAAQAQLDRADREASSVVSTARRFLQLFAGDAIIARNTASSTFTLEELADDARPTTLYIVTKAIDAHRLRPLVRLLFTQAMLHLLNAELRFDAAGRALPAHRFPVLMVLDEFAALGRMEILEQSLARCLGYGVTALVAVQDISQLRRAYGQNQNVSNNTNLRVAFPPNEHDTAVWISHQLGTATVTTPLQSRSWGPKSWVLPSSISEAVQHTSRQLLLADEVLSLPKPQRERDGTITAPGKVVIMEAGKRAILGEQLLYFDDPEMRRRAAIQPGAVARAANENVAPFPMGQGYSGWAKTAAAGGAVVLLIGGWGGIRALPEREHGSALPAFAELVPPVVQGIVPGLQPPPPKLGILPTVSPALDLNDPTLSPRCLKRLAEVPGVALSPVCRQVLKLPVLSPMVIDFQTQQKNEACRLVREAGESAPLPAYCREGANQPTNGR